MERDALTSKDVLKSEYHETWGLLLDIFDFDDSNGAITPKQ